MPLASQWLTINSLTVVLKIAVAFVLVLVVAWIYKKTHRGLAYSQSFVFTIVILGVLIAIVMMVIGSSLAAAFTLLGAFAIVRFRTAIKDTRDIAFIFWSLVTGMAVGTGSYILAIISTALVSVIVLVLSKTNFGSMRNYDHIVTFVIDISRASNDAYKPLFEKYLKNNILLNVNSRQAGTKLEFTFNIIFSSSTQIANFVSELRGVAGIESVNLITASDDIEY